MVSRLFVEELTKMVLESGLLLEEEGHYVLPRHSRRLPSPSTLAGFAHGPA